MEEHRIRELQIDINSLLESGVFSENDKLHDYFTEVIGFASRLCSVWGRFHKMEEDRQVIPLEELIDINAGLYEQILPENYSSSYVNPEYAVKAFGTDIGRLLCAISAEIRAAIPSVFGKDLSGFVSRLLLILDTARAASEDLSAESLRSVFYKYYHDNLPFEQKKKLHSQLVPGSMDLFAEYELEDFLLFASDRDNRGALLYVALWTGEYITDNELEVMDKLCSLPGRELVNMARTYVNGYVKGFAMTSKDISIKKTAEIRFNLGFLPMAVIAGHILKREHGLDTSVMRAGYSIFTGRSVEKNGFFGANPNPQYDLDHKDDLSLIIDESLVDHRLNVLKESYEELKKEARLYGGPAVIEIFGEPEFTPVTKPEAASYDDKTRPLTLRYMSEAGVITNTYIPGEERSFTIIAYPMPSIGDNFDEVFDATVLINNLDYELYRDIQQKLIDALDTAEYVEVCGRDGNSTDLRVKLHTLTDPIHQTNFENCVADVNIPVGEVFTSPVLEGTDGVLHVKHVFLNGIEYHNLTIRVKNGFTSEYSCDEGAKLIEDNILFHHPSLPMGECAIGTNTTAYVLARRLGIESRLPILIAEKMGPHFAFGDTCYSHEEDLKTLNPDGKQIIARENEVSRKRISDPASAYFNCHTDITVPYDELGRLSAVLPDGSKVDIILNGRFVLEGCEPLNAPFDENFLNS